MSTGTYWQTPYVYRSSSGTFAGTTIVTRVDIPTSFSVYSEPQGGGSPQNGAFSIQQNVNAATHWYQNTLIQNVGEGMVWHLEDFYSTGGHFPLDGQFYRTTDPAGVPPSGNPFGTTIPSSIVLTNGNYSIFFYISDNGVDTIAQRVVITNYTTQAVLYDSLWAVVNSNFTQPSNPPSGNSTVGSWYDPLTAVSGVLVGVGGGDNAVFSNAPFVVSHDAGTTIVDLIYGGTYFQQTYYPGDDTWYPYNQPAPPVNIGTGETANIWYWQVTYDSNQGASGIFLEINGFNGVVYLKTNDTINWISSGMTDDEGGIMKFGLVPHGVDPAPPGAGFMVVQQETVNGSGIAQGTISYTGSLTALTPDTRVLQMTDGLDLDFYSYDCARKNATGYSQPVEVRVSNAITFATIISYPP